MIKEQAKYICDVCGEEIETVLPPELVTVSYKALRGNGWDMWDEQKEKHVHKKCLCKLNVND